jgi:thioredoxin 1
VADLPSVEDASFETEVLNADRPVVVDFWAPWCGPCRVVDPILSDMAAQHGDRVKFVALNVDENPATQARYQVLSIPTVILFEGGEPRQTIVGARSRTHYEGAWEPWLRSAA